MSQLPTSLDRFYHYWQSLPKVNGSLLPARLSFHPDDLIDILPRISLMKRFSRFEIMVGLVGSEADGLWRRPMTGMNVFDMAAPSMRENMAQFFDTILKAPSAAVFTTQATNSSGKPIDVTSLYMPLCDKRGQANYILGCTMPTNIEGKKHNWQGALKDQLMLSPQQAIATKFIDIGAGIPKMKFALTQAKETAPREDTLKHWWDKIIPLNMHRNKPVLRKGQKGSIQEPPTSRPS